MRVSTQGTRFPECPCELAHCIKLFVLLITSWLPRGHTGILSGTYPLPCCPSSLGNRIRLGAMDPSMFSQGLTRAASAVVLSRFLGIIRMAVGIYTSFRGILPRWKVFLRWVYWRQPNALSRPQQEQEQYWLESDLYNRQLRSIDARCGGWEIQGTPRSVLITYYVPRLLPVYRSPHVTDIDAAPYRLSAKKFCKWHHMVFRGPLHPTLSRAQKLMKNYSNRDLQEMYRISRLLSDEEVCRGAARRTKRYKDMWIRWLDTKGPDVAIVFDEPVRSSFRPQ